MTGFQPKVVDLKALIEDVNERGEREARQNEELLRQTAEKLERERKAKEKEEEEERKREEEKAAAREASKSTDSESAKVTSSGSIGDSKDREVKEPETTECKIMYNNMILPKILSLRNVHFVAFTEVP